MIGPAPLRQGDLLGWADEPSGSARLCRAMKIGNVSFGGTAAIVTSVALIFGLDAATATKSTIVSGLLIVALADNSGVSPDAHAPRHEPAAQQGRTLRARD
jgi:hypothetical protein